jgi:hypothetical protein
MAADIPWGGDMGGTWIEFVKCLEELSSEQREALVKVNFRLVVNHFQLLPPNVKNKKVGCMMGLKGAGTNGAMTKKDWDKLILEMWPKPDILIGIKAKRAQLAQGERPGSVYEDYGAELKEMIGNVPFVLQVLLMKCALEEPSFSALIKGINGRALKPGRTSRLGPSIVAPFCTWVDDQGWEVAAGEETDGGESEGGAEEAKAVTESMSGLALESQTSAALKEFESVIRQEDTRGTRSTGSALKGSTGASRSKTKPARRAQVDVDLSSSARRPLTTEDEDEEYSDAPRSSLRGGRTEQDHHPRRRSRDRHYSSHKRSGGQRRGGGGRGSRRRSSRYQNHSGSGSDYYSSSSEGEGDYDRLTRLSRANQTRPFCKEVLRAFPTVRGWVDGVVPAWQSVRNRIEAQFWATALDKLIEEEGGGRWQAVSHSGAADVMARRLQSLRVMEKHPGAYGTAYADLIGESVLGSTIPIALATRQALEKRVVAKVKEAGLEGGGKSTGSH